MSGSVNKVILIGNLGKDPEVKSFQNGGKICNFSIATSEDWKDRTTGEKKERTEWHNITLNSEGLVSVAERFLRKGSKVYLEGKLQTRKWQDASGSDRYSTEVVVGGFDGKLVMLDGAKGNEGAPRQNGSATPDNSGFGGGGFGADDDFGDEVPFVSCNPALERHVF